MFLPLRDENPTVRTPYMTVGLMAVCILVFLWQQSLPQWAAAQAVWGFGAVPALVFGYSGAPPELSFLPPTLTLISSMFLHGGWLHIAGNMLYLWIFGNNIEDILGHGRFMAFYLAAGIAAALAHGLTDPQSMVPMIGASGAISGVLGAYILSFPKARVTVLLWILIPLYKFKIPAWMVIGIWFGLQVLSFLGDEGDKAGGVAWMAHIGGFIAGLILLPVLRPAGAPPAPPPSWRPGPWG